ncbi:MAG TPA: XdhC family protein [Pyrinomonadaceae bacterium]|nr:XdhC family protein [Pyrinomonadaceae bacterium]
MHKELELWQFVAERLYRDESVMLLVVAESSGSSPGRQGYKMAVGADGELVGSIGGGVMEVRLVDLSRQILSDPTESNSAFRAPRSALSEQVHRENSPHASGMICSGKQTVIFKLLTSSDARTVDSIIDSLVARRPDRLTVTALEFKIEAHEGGSQNDFTFDKLSDSDFRFTERLGFKNDLYIIGGGHCALALSELMSKMDFHISLFDDRPDLNTIDKNRFAHRIEIVDSYETIADEVPAGANSYVVVMTLGYASDERVIRALLDKEFKYFGVLGSSAKMSVMLRKLLKEGFPAKKLDRIRTPIGLPINSHTPDEIAVSIAAEIISVKNS